MALYVCKRCSTRFAVGLHRCPQCTSESAYLLDDAAEAEVLAGGPLPNGAGMPKTTVHGGASNARTGLDEAAERAEVDAEVEADVPGAEVEPDGDPESDDDETDADAEVDSEDGSTETPKTRAKPAKAARSR